MFVQVPAIEILFVQRIFLCKDLRTRFQILLYHLPILYFCFLFQAFLSHLLENLNSRTSHYRWNLSPSSSQTIVCNNLPVPYQKIHPRKRTNGCHFRSPANVFPASRRCPHPQNFFLPLLCLRKGSLNSHFP